MVKTVPCRNKSQTNRGISIQTFWPIVSDYLNFRVSNREGKIPDMVAVCGSRYKPFEPTCVDIRI